MIFVVFLGIAIAVASDSDVDGVQLLQLGLDHDTLDGVVDLNSTVVANTAEAGIEQSHLGVSPRSSTPNETSARSNVSHAVAVRVNLAQSRVPVERGPELTAKGVLLIWGACLTTFFIISCLVCVGGSESHAPEGKQDDRKAEAVRNNATRSTPVVRSRFNLEGIRQYISGGCTAGLLARVPRNNRGASSLRNPPAQSLCESPPPQAVAAGNISEHLKGNSMEPAQAVKPSFFDDKAGVEAQFDGAVGYIQSLSSDAPVSPTNDEKLVAYGLFKQVNFGDNDTPKPSMIKVEASLKWEAWASNKGMQKTEAMTKYVEHVRMLYTKYPV